MSTRLEARWAIATVEILWTVRAKPVEKLRVKFFWLVDRPQAQRSSLLEARLRDPLRLIVTRWIGKIVSLFETSAFRRSAVTVHRFEENIAGRNYLIEVTAAGPQWRAQLMRRPGTTTAMMPFYGSTPPEAAPA